MTDMNHHKRLRELVRQVAAAERLSASECRDIATEVAVLVDENSDLREALMDVCASHETTRIQRQGIRAIRGMANQLSVPFSLANVERYALEERDDPEAWCQNRASDCADRDSMLLEMRAIVLGLSASGVAVALDEQPTSSAGVEVVRAADVDVGRLRELAVRLVAGGPKASHVSASECHEIADGLIEALDALENDTCARHAGQVHGKEAEELRKGIEQILAYGRDDEAEVTRAALRRLLDQVDARDSLAYLESKDAADGGKPT